MRIGVIVTKRIGMSAPKSDDDAPLFKPHYAESTYALELLRAFPFAHVIAPKGSRWESWAAEEGVDERCFELDMDSDDPLGFADAVRGHLLSCTYDVVEAVGSATPLLLEQIVGNHPTVVRMTTDKLDDVMCGHMPLEETYDLPAPYAQATVRQRMWDAFGLHQECVRRADMVIGHGAHHASKAKALGHARFVDLPMALDTPKPYDPITVGERKVLVLVGRADKTKGADLLTKVLRAIPEDWRVTVVAAWSGGEFEFQQISEAVEGRGSVYNGLSTEELRKALMATSVVINTSKLMVGGRLTLEAFSHGKQVICFDPADPAKASWPVHRLGHWGDPQSFKNIPRALEAAVTGEVKQHTSQWNDLQAFASDYSWRTLIPRYKSIYQLAIATGVATGRPTRGW